MEEKLKQIINNYGIMPQLKYFQSEVFELNEAVIEYEKDKENPIINVSKALVRIVDSLSGRDTEKETYHIAEEIADVMVMLEQFKLFYNISDESIEEVMRQKVDRQIERIEKGE